MKKLKFPYSNSKYCEQNSNITETLKLNETFLFYFKLIRYRILNLYLSCNNCNYFVFHFDFGC